MHFDLYGRGGIEDLCDRVTGRGQRSVLVIYATTPEKQAGDQVYLHTILQAAGFNPVEEGVYLLAVDSTVSFSLTDLARRLEARYILLFGLDSSQTGLRAQIPFYTPVSLAGNTYLSAHSLATIKAERERGIKQKAGELWNALKQLFVDK